MKSCKGFVNDRMDMLMVISVGLEFLSEKLEMKLEESVVRVDAKMPGNYHLDNESMEMR